MMVRAEPGAVMFFVPAQARTAIISGAELDKLEEWVNTGVINDLVKMLLELGIIPASSSERESMRPVMAETIERSKYCSSPLRSFAVPESIHIEVTTRCNLTCPQCYKGRPAEGDMDLTVLKEIITEAGTSGVFQIAFGGGEPLIYPYLREAVREVKAQGMACTLTTNGKALGPSLLQDLKNWGIDHIQVSLNGSTAAIDEYSRGGYKEALQALRLLRGSGISYGINWTARKDNLYDFPAMISLARDYGAENINILRLKPSGEAAWKAQALSAAEFGKLAEFINQAAKSTVRVKLDSAYSNLLAYIYRKTPSLLFGGCGAGRRFMAVDVDGSFKACSHIDYRERFDTIQEYWYGSDFLKQLRAIEEDIGEPCRSCSSVHHCRGCRAICQNLYGSFKAGESDCPARS